MSRRGISRTKDGVTYFSSRNSEFYKAKKRGEKVECNFEYKQPISYIVKFESGHSIEVMAVNSKDASRQSYHLQSEHGYIKGSSKKNQFDV